MKRETFLTPLEVKFAGDSEAMSFSGYGARFGNLDSYGDVIAPGAFTKTLKEAKASGNWPAMLLQHGSFLGGDDNMPVGVWTDMREDEKGLYVEGQLAPTARGKDAYTLLKMSPRPAINGMSIGYRAIEWSMRGKPEEPRRTLKAVELFEVSLVTFPANGKARIEAVKTADDIKTIREFEDALTNGMLPALSAKEAKALLAGGFKAIRSERDAGEMSDELADAIRRNTQLLSR